MKQNLLDVLNSLKGLTYKELKEFDQAVEKALRDKTAEYYAPGGEYDFECRAAAEQAKREQAEREAHNRIWFPRLKTWIDANLKKGMRVRMRGCRDGVGLREVFDIHDETIQCIQLNERKNWNTGNIKTTVGGMTTHHFSKIRMVLIDNQWVKIEEIVEKSLNNA